MLTIRPDLQDRQLGRALLAHGETYAQGLGAKRVRMTVVHLRDTLIAWYQRRGYALTGETEPFLVGERFGRPQRELSFVVLEKTPGPFFSFSPPPPASGRRAQAKRRLAAPACAGRSHAGRRAKDVKLGVRAAIEIRRAADASPLSTGTTGSAGGVDDERRRRIGDQPSVRLQGVVQRLLLDRRVRDGLPATTARPWALVEIGP